MMKTAANNNSNLEKLINQKESFGILNNKFRRNNSKALKTEKIMNNSKLY